MEPRLKEICRLSNKNYGIFADMSQGGMFLVIAGEGKIQDITSSHLNLIRTTQYLEPEEKKKLDAYLS